MSGKDKGGRPTVRKNISALARQYTEQALLTLAEIASDVEAPHAARVSACNHILDRGYGKPSQQLEHTGDEGGPIEGKLIVEFIRPGEDT